MGLSQSQLATSIGTAVHHQLPVAPRSQPAFMGETQQAEQEGTSSIIESSQSSHSSTQKGKRSSGKHIRKGFY